MATGTGPRCRHCEQYGSVRRSSISRRGQSVCGHFGGAPMVSDRCVRCGIVAELRRRMFGRRRHSCRERSFGADLRVAGRRMRSCGHRRHRTLARVRNRSKGAPVRDCVFLGRSGWDRWIALLRTAGCADRLRLGSGGTRSARFGGLRGRPRGSVGGFGNRIHADRRTAANAMAGRCDGNGRGRPRNRAWRLLRDSGVNTHHPLRRIALATVAVAVSGVLLRGQMADALVVRGDEFLYRSDSRAALRYYRRALRFDATNAVALDRLLFVATILRDRVGMRDGVQRAAAYLERRPDDDAIRMDRAMAWRALGKSAFAWIDFGVVGYRTRDARALALAGFAARDAAREVAARRLWRAALTLAPGMPAASHALARDGVRP